MTLSPWVILLPQIVGECFFSLSFAIPHILYLPFFPSPPSHWGPSVLHAKLSLHCAGFFFPPLPFPLLPELQNTLAAAAPLTCLMLDMRNYERCLCTRLSCLHACTERWLVSLWSPPMHWYRLNNLHQASRCKQQH